MGKLRFVLAIFALSCLSEGAKILVVFPFPGRSHNILGEGVCRALLKDGHEVTYITPFPKKEATPNLRYIDVSNNIEAMSTDILDLKAIVDNKSSSIVVHFIKGLFNGGGFLNLTSSTFSSKDMVKLVNDPDEKFDLVVIEWMFSEIYVGLPAIFDCPYIWVSSSSPYWMVLSLIDEGLNPAYNPDILSSNIPPLNFGQRVGELFSQILWGFLRTFLMLPTQSKDYDIIFGPILAKKGRSPTFNEMLYNASLVLGNNHVSTSGSTRLPQNYKPIGGYHIDPDVKPLPEDLKKIMDNANYGVIYFSLGSNVKSKDLPDEIKQSLLKMFGELKYTVIWKFEEKLSGLPKNVHILHWAPQPSILAHSKCILFITHGGLLSLTEVIHFGVPIIGVPVFADQFTNVEVSKKRGFALKVDLSYNMADDLKIAIEEILRNPKYKEKISELNLIYHDRPVRPADELTHWVNHVIRTNGAPHLRSVALMVPWYQKYYLDFLALVLVIIFFISKAVKVLCCSKKKITKTTSSKKKNH